jgi:archaellum component FlaC
MNIKIKQYSKDIEARFLDDSSVPSELKNWWNETRDNLERLKDKITELSLQVELLSQSSGSGANTTNQFTDAQAEQLARFVEFWEITTDGSLVPYTHNASDLGSAQRKVRDIYEKI